MYRFNAKQALLHCIITLLFLITSVAIFAEPNVYQTPTLKDTDIAFIDELKAHPTFPKISGEYLFVFGLPDPAEARKLFEQYQKVFVLNVDSYHFIHYAQDLDQDLREKLYPFFRDPDPLAQRVLIEAIYSDQATIKLLTSPVNRSFFSTNQYANQFIEGFVSDESPLKDSLSDLNGINAILTIPDPTIINTTNIRYMFRKLYRQGIPIFGYSQKLVKIGATGSLYNTDKSYIEQTLTRIFEQDRIGYPYLFNYDLAWNDDIARTSNIPKPDPEDINQKIYLLYQEVSNE